MAEQRGFPSGQAAAEWRAKWTLVLAATLGFSVVGMSIYSLGAFFKPLHEAFGWDRTLISAGPTVYAATSLICQPFVGRMIDRWGPRRIALIGVVLSAISYALFATANGSPTGWLLLWLLYSLSVQLILMSTWSSAVASEFEAGRGLALAFTLGGSALSGVVAPISALLLIEAYDWRTAFVVIALVTGLIVLVASWFFFHSRLDTRRTAVATAQDAALPGLSLSEAFRTSSFYKLSFGIFLGYMMPVASLVHMLPILEENGLAPAKAAGVAALFGIFAMIGKIIGGALVNRVGGQLLAAAVIAIAVPGYLIIMSPGQPALLLSLAVALLGASAGGQLHMLVYLTTRHFGMRAFGSIFGFIGSSVIIAGGSGPLVAGRLYDYFGNYQVMLMVGIPMAAIGTLLLLWLGDYPEVRQARRLARAAAE